MEHTGYLSELLILGALGIVAATLLTRFRLPAMAGLLLTGALGGPNGFGLVREVEVIEQIAEIGVVLLLFTIGLEFSAERLRRLGRVALVGGTLQVLLTLGATLLIGVSLGLSVPVALFFGFVITLSSTAIVLRLYTERSELDSPNGRFLVGVLIFQDIAVVLFMLLTPLLAEGGGPKLWIELGHIGLRAIVLLGGLYFFSRYVLGHLFRLVDASRSRELFIMTTLTIALGAAAVSASAGLSLALGAFLAGVLVSNSDYAHRAMGEILPLRDVLTSLFFISLGMLFDWRTVVAQPLAVGLLLLAFIVGKGLIGSVAALLSGYPARVAWVSGVGLAQFGEFGFVLAATGIEAGLVTDPLMSPVLAAGIVSMFAAPILIMVAPNFRAGEKLLQPLERLLPGHTTSEERRAESPQRDHVILAGYGPAGRLLSRTFKARNIPYLVLDLNVGAVRRARDEGDPVHYGDITHPDTLHHANMHDARALVIMFNDPEGVPRAVDAVRRHAPQVPIFVRCRYFSEADRLLKLGADLVVVEEVETGVTMLRRVLRQLGHPEDETRDVVRRTREELRLDTERVTV